ncbi:hypothetical protein NQ318_012301 [Aromia moschata]|uniref:Alpha-mannosidase n=1 Tax=Aromia moschata TaxID=1265417 RepID=A0AAV8YJG1_9CUCU|nr:hypothetical protein NQ318_012301 [Aromia moschata]
MLNTCYLHYREFWKYDIASDRHCANARHRQIQRPATIKRFEELGHTGRRPGNGRKRTVRTVEKRERVRERVRRNPRSQAVSMRKIARQTGINRESIRQIAKEDHLKPYKLQKVQLLTDVNKRVLLERCKQLLRRHAPLQWDKILFTDEKQFKHLDDFGGQGLREAPQKFGGAEAFLAPGMGPIVTGSARRKNSERLSPAESARRPLRNWRSCHEVDHDKINVHLVPHSHDDVGWLKTKDQYYYYEVQFIISSVVSALSQNADRRFIQVETAFFYMWWNKQTDEIKSLVRQLINEGRLEIVNGAWSMNDEGAVHYQSTIDQYTLGLRFIEDALGKCARPRVSWQIDPFGHSREQASLLTQMGMDAVFFARIDYRDKEKRMKEKTLDLLWSGSANLGSDSNIFASTLYNHYSCPPNFCFDIHCNDDPIITDESSAEYNWETKVNDFVTFIKAQTQHFSTPHVLVTLGDDFQWQAAHVNYANVDNLIEGFKVFNPKIDGKEINIIYSTPSCYTKAVRDYVEEKNITLDIKTDDFFPYAVTASEIFSGYFTSRPTSKRLERFANNLLQVNKQITTIAGACYEYNNTLSQAMGVMQHHDAISGTEREAVEKDYHRSLVQGMTEAIPQISSSISSILGLSDDLNLKSCLLANVSICSESDKDEFTVLIYNPLARTVSHYIQIPVNDGTWKVTDPSGEEIETYLSSPIDSFDYVGKNISQKVLDKVLFFRAENLPALGYKAYKIEKTSSETVASREGTLAVDQIGFEDRFVNFDLSTGLLRSITLNNVTLDVSQEMMYYRSWEGGSNAYLFRPNGTLREAIKFGNATTGIRVNNGNLVREVIQMWNNWVTQIIRVYKEEDFIEFDWLVGPIYANDNISKEVITRYTTKLNTTDEFYTDSNGREIIYRKKNFRPTYEYTDEEPQSGNYYPVNTKISIKDDEYEFAVLTDRSEGGTSLNSGEVELMLSRNLIHITNGGTGENLEELEYDQLLVARGSHFVTLGKSSEGHDLPENVHLLTLENWNASTNQILIRLEHILEKNEDPNLSKEETVDLSGLFKTIKVTSMKEYTLAANTPLEEISRLEWPQITKIEDELSPLNKNYRLSRDETDLEITLAPMQIRTFVATIERMPENF